MINAHQAREKTMNCWLGSLSADEKTAHFYVEAKIREAIDNGWMSVYFDNENTPDLFDLIIKTFSTDKFHNYYAELGYYVRVDTERLTGGLLIKWT